MNLTKIEKINGEIFETTTKTSIKTIVESNNTFSIYYHGKLIDNVKTINEVHDIAKQYT